MRKSIFFRSITRLLFPTVLVLSAFLFVRGHNAPGGGFIAGLLAAVSIAVIALSFDVAHALKAYRVRSFSFVSTGLLIAGLSGFVSVFVKPGARYFEGYWLGAVGTPVLFDFGVFLVVLGVGVNFVLSLMED